MPDFDIFLNVIKRPELIVYKSRVTDQSANIAYVGSIALSSDVNMNIQDKSGSLAPNRAIENVKIWNAEQCCSVETSDFHLTDVFSEEINSAPSQPLFFQHKFKNFDSTTEYISSVKVYDDLFNETSFVYTKRDDEEGVFYSNIESFYNVIPDQKDSPDGIEYTYYYITYTVTNKATLEVKSFQELLNNEPVYREAEFEDYDEETLLLDVSKKVYTISSGTEGFELTLSGLRKFAIDTKRDVKLKLLRPTSKDYSDPWHIRVSNGKFYYKNTLYKIAEPQFNSQTFNPQLGIKKIEKETPTLIRKNIIKLDNEDILDDSASDLHVFLRITRSSGAKYGFTTDPEDASSEYSHWPSDGDKGIASIDQKTGYIELVNFDLEVTDKIEVDYYHNENYYNYTTLDFNPIRKEEVLYRTVVFYIDPTDPDSSLKHGEFSLEGEALGPPEFLTASIQGDPIFPQGADSNFAEFLKSTTGENKPLFLLGSVTVGEASGVRDLVTLDTRIDGGGIKESKVDEVEAQHPEYISFFNSGSWDGIPFPGNLNYLVKIPIKGVVEGYEGKVAVKQIKEIIGRHTALGVYPLVRAYGPEIKFDSDNAFEISRVDATHINVKINWKAVGNTTYNIFYKKTTDQSWTAGPSVTPNPVDNTVISMTGTVASLLGNSNYHFTVLGQETIDSVSTDLFTQHISSIAVSYTHLTLPTKA